MPILVPELKFPGGDGRCEKRAIGVGRHCPEARALLMLRAHAPYSIARRAKGHLDFDGGDRTLGVAALPVGSWQSVCESGSEDFFRRLQISPDI
jgi:hypothetical protein